MMRCTADGSPMRVSCCEHSHTNTNQTIVARLRATADRLESHPDERCDVVVRTPEGLHWIHSPKDAEDMVRFCRLLAGDDDTNEAHALRSAFWGVVVSMPVGGDE